MYNCIDDLEILERKMFGSAKILLCIIMWK